MCVCACVCVCCTTCVYVCMRVLAQVCAVHVHCEQTIVIQTITADITNV